MTLRHLLMIGLLLCTTVLAGDKKPSGPPTAPECDALMTRFLDLAVADFLADPENKDMSKAEKAIAVAAFKAEFAKDDDFKAMKKDCRAFSRARYECIMKAKTFDSIDACL